MRPLRLLHLLILLFVFFIHPLFAAENPGITLTAQEKEWLRQHSTIPLAGIKNQPPYLIQCGNGTITGIIPDYLDRINHMLDTQLVVTQLAPPSALHDLAKEKGYFGAAAVFEMPQVHELYTLTQSYLSSPFNIFTTSDQVKEIQNTDDLQGKRVVILKNHHGIRNYLEKIKNINIIEVLTPHDQFQMLLRKQADALAGYANYHYLISTRMLTDISFAFASTELHMLHMGINKKHPELVSILNKAIGAIEQSEIQAINDKWIYRDTPFGSHSLDLNREERAFIRQHPTVTVGVMDEYIPFSFKKDGKFTGMTHEVLQLISQKSGLTFKTLAGSWSQNLRLFKKKQLDVISEISYLKERESFTRFSSPYYEIPIAAYTRIDYDGFEGVNSLAGKKVGLTKNSFLVTRLHAMGNVIIKEYETSREYLGALAKGEIDIAISSILTSYHLDETGLQNIRFAGIVTFKDIKKEDLRFGVHKENPMLASIIQKAMDSITFAEMTNLRNRWILQPGYTEDRPKIVLSPEEKAYREKHPTIHASNRADHAPYDFVQGGIPQGYSIDLLNLLSDQVGIEVQYVQNLKWSQQLELFQKGKIDLLHSHAKTSERQNLGIYSTPYHRFKSHFITRTDTPDIFSIKELYGKAFALRKGCVAEEYLMTRHPQIKLLFYDTLADVLDAVSSGKAYASCLADSVARYTIRKEGLSDLKVSGWFKEFDNSEVMKYYFVGQKESPELISLLNKALISLSSAEIQALEAKWFGKREQQESIHRISFTPEEAAYLNSKDTITMCIDPDWMPFEKNDNGKHIGMSADYFSLFQKAINKPITMIPTQTWSESLEAGKKRECDIFSLVMPTPDRRAYLDFTQPYLKTPLVIATQIQAPSISDISEIGDKKLGIVKGYAYGEILRKTYPKMQLIDVRNLKDGLDKVNSGELYGFIGTLASVGYHIQQGYIGLIKIAGKFDENWELGIGTRNDEPLLNPIFNKAIALISQEQHQQILNRWISVTFENTKTNPNALSAQEKAFLKRHPVIRFRTRPNRAPFEFYEDGKTQGIAVEYIRMIAREVGFTPEFVVDNRPVKEAYKMIEHGREEFDTILFTVKNPERAKRFSFGDAFLSYPVMIISHKQSPYIGGLSDLKGKKVAIEKGFLTNKWLKKDYPEIQIIPARDTKDALEMVNRTDADAYVGNMAITNYMMVHGDMDNLKIMAPTEYANVKYQFIAPKEWPELTSILSKGFRQISQEEHSAIQQKWFSFQIINTADYSLLWKILGISALIILWILWWNYQLKKRVAEGVEKYKQSQAMLVQQSKMASMGEMIGMIAHQWKQPLNSISIYAQEINEIIEFNESDPELLHSIHHNIMDQVHHMGTTIDDFRNFYKPSENKIAFKVSTLSSEVCDLISAKLKNLNVEIIMHDQDRFTLKGSPNEFKQVLLNIYNNACDVFVEHNIKERKIHLFFDHDETMARIRIQDTGGGIPEHLLPDKLFDPYITTKGKNGTGIGLQISKTIIEEKFGGTLSASNIEGGAEFMILIPLDS